MGGERAGALAAKFVALILAQVSSEKGIRLNLSGNEFYNTNYLVLLVKNMMCRKFHCQKGLNLFIFHMKSLQNSLVEMGGERAGALSAKFVALILAQVLY